MDTVVLPWPIERISRPPRDSATMTPRESTESPDTHASTDHRCLADRLGVFAAAACAVHCMAAPVILALAPLLGGIWTSPRTHWVFAAISLPAALSLLNRNLRRKSGVARRWLMGLALLGSTLVLAGLAAPGADWSQGRGVHAELPSWLSSEPAASATEAVCHDECCASVHTDTDGQRKFFVPMASLLTMLGGVLLVTAHAVALRRTGCTARS